MTDTISFHVELLQKQLDELYANHAKTTLLEAMNQQLSQAQQSIEPPKGLCPQCIQSVDEGHSRPQFFRSSHDGVSQLREDALNSELVGEKRPLAFDNAIRSFADDNSRIGERLHNQFYQLPRDIEGGSDTNGGLSMQRNKAPTQQPLQRRKFGCGLPPPPSRANNGTSSLPGCSSNFGDVGESVYADDTKGSTEDPAGGPPSFRSANDVYRVQLRAQGREPPPRAPNPNANGLRGVGNSKKSMKVSNTGFVNTAVNAATGNDTHKSALERVNGDISKLTLLEKYGGDDPLFEIPPHLEGVNLTLADEFATIAQYRGKQVPWSSIAGLDTVKELLFDSLTIPLLITDMGDHSDILELPTAILLFGPPGTGKTMLAKAAASTLGYKFFSITASSIGSKWHGQSESNVKALFGAARELAPSIIFLDEIDALLTMRKDDDNDAIGSRVKTEFLTEMDGANTQAREGFPVIIVGATNRPDSLDEAVRRRFTRRILIPLPDAAARREHLSILLDKHKLPKEVSEADIDAVVAETEGYSCADITEICKQAVNRAFRRYKKNSGVMAMFETVMKRSDGETGTSDTGDRPVSLPAMSASSIQEPLRGSDLLKALKQISPSVSQADIERHRKFNELYGWKGVVDDDDDDD